MKTLMLFFTQFFVFCFLCAQEIDNINFEQVGNKIYIYYDVLNILPGQKAHLDVFYRLDEAKSWKGPLKELNGAFGEITNSGISNMIIWEAMKEAGEIVGQLEFKLELKIIESSYIGANGKFTDSRDKYEYKWIRIGDFIWMAGNLHYDAGEGSWCHMDLPGNCNKFGRLYNYTMAVKVCPEGWHLPSDLEWKQLERELGMNKNDLNKAGERMSGNVGKDLKQMQSPAFISDFTGYFDNSYLLDNEVAAFWTGTTLANNSDFVFYRIISRETNGIARYTTNKNSGMYVRCITSDE